MVCFSLKRKKIGYPSEDEVSSVYIQLSWKCDTLPAVSIQTVECQIKNAKKEIIHVSVVIFEFVQWISHLLPPFCRLSLPIGLVYLRPNIEAWVRNFNVILSLHSSCNSALTQTTCSFPLLHPMSTVFK